MNTDNPLKAIAFFDTRPGHMKQTSGILKSLAAITSLQSHSVTIEIPSSTKEIQNWLRFFCLQKSSSFNHLKDHDFIIGTGTYTHIPMLTCKRELSLPVFTCMNPSTLLQKQFDLCFIPYHDQIKTSQNIFFTNGPPNLCRSKNRHDKNKGLILIGGIDNKSHQWNTYDLISMITTLVTTEKNIHWTISSSPRTPPDTISTLQTLPSKHPNCLFSHFKDTETGWIEKQYNACQTVWVTADSMSMVYEALSAGCRVGLLPVKWKKNSTKFQRSEQNLLSENLVISFEKWKLEPSFPHIINPLNEAENCAKEILRRWWPNRLQ